MDEYIKVWYVGVYVGLDYILVGVDLDWMVGGDL